MEGSLLVGDHILCNNFVYGIRTPDWIGIPYTKLGFFVPYTRLPGFREPASGDVVIFKYPRNLSEYYVKRCIAVSGDTVEIRDRNVYVNGALFSNAKRTQFIGERIIPEGIGQQGIFPPGSGNIHNYGPIRIPAQGDTFRFQEDNKAAWFPWLQRMAYEGNRITLSDGRVATHLTVENIDRWQQAIRLFQMDAFSVNGKSLAGYLYTVRDRQYFMTGDNRDNSLDSRFWGCVPERHIVGEALMVYWSWNHDIPLYRLTVKWRWKRTFNLIR